MRQIAALLLVAVLGLSALGAPVVAARDAGEPVQTLDWKDLVPPGYNPNELLMRYQREVASMRDDDPRADKLAADLRKAWENAPVVQALNNKAVKLSGFLVTLDGDDQAVSEFLLVPFFGACIHVPPPPSNQIVLVRTGQAPFKAGRLFQRVSVTGRLRTEPARNALASASYVLEATRVQPDTP